MSGRAQPLPPLQGGMLVIATIGISVVTAMTVLDSTIANVALPTIAGNLGVASSQGTWVITFFGVANAIAIPLTGWLARRMGEVRLYFWSTFLFVVASFLCGISSSLGMLIICRILQGAAAGPLIPLSQSLLLACYPREKRGIALSLWSMTIVLAPILGPILGGYICDNYTWNWIFFVNVPVGAVCLVALRIPMAGRETATAKNPIDTVGLILLIIGVGCLQLMLDEGKDKDWFASGYIVILGVLTVVGLVLLVAWELTEEHPVVDLSLFRHRNFTVGTICISLGFLFYFAGVVMMPMMLQTRLGYTSMWAGLSLAPIGIFPVFLSPLIGRFAQRIDMRVIVTMSFLVFSAAFYLRTLFSPDVDFAFVLWPQVVQGIGVAMFFMPLTSIIISGLDAKDIANASSLSNCTRVLAGSIGSSLATTMWERQEALHHVRLTESINPFNPAAQHGLNQLTQMGLSPEQAKVWVANEITRQGFLLGFNELFWLASIAFIGLAGLVWLSTPINKKIREADAWHNKRNAGKRRKRAGRPSLTPHWKNSPQRGTPERAWKISPGGPGSPRARCICISGIRRGCSTASRSLRSRPCTRWPRRSSTTRRRPCAKSCSVSAGRCWMNKAAQGRRGSSGWCGQKGCTTPSSSRRSTTGSSPRSSSCTGRTCASPRMSTRTRRSSGSRSFSSRRSCRGCSGKGCSRTRPRST